jgi:tetratricopeptide (TPR) repeat protein
MAEGPPVLGGNGLLSRKFQEALSFHEQGKLSEAERAYREILGSDDGHVGSLVHLGMIRVQTGSIEDAIDLFRKAVDRDPNSADAHAGLANALLAQSRLDEAAAAYREALAIDPDLAEANYGLATALQGLKRFEEAIIHYESAIATDPEYAEAHHGLASTLQALNRHAQAVSCFERALSVDPQFAEANYGLGIALQALDRHEEAIRSYQNALASAPGFADAHNNLGGALQQLGRLEDARVAFERALALAPRKVEFYLNLLDIKKLTADDRHFAGLQALAKDEASLEPEDRINLHFAMGKALAQVGDERQAFDHLLEGNSLKRQEVVHDEVAAWRMFERIQAVFSAELMRSKQGGGDLSQLPIFIVGMPRSGSSLVEQILASHPKVFGAGERLELRDALNSFGEASEISLPFPERFLVATGEELRRLGADYLNRLKISLPSPPGDWQRITDKMPENCRLVGLIHLALPNARIIHTCRDPVDTCLSCFSIHFTADQPFAYDLGELGRYYRAYYSLMEHWRQVLPEGLMLDAHYEDLVGDLEGQARRIVAHCGLEWDDDCLAYDKTARPVKTASAAQVRQPIYRSSVGRWRPDADVLKPLLDGLGPDLAGGLPGRAAR